MIDIFYLMFIFSEFLGSAFYISPDTGFALQWLVVG